MGGGETVAYNIDATALLIFSKPDNNCKAGSNFTNSSESIGSFRDSLSRALTDRSQRESKAGQVKDNRKELVFKSRPKFEGKINEDLNKLEEGKEKNTVEKDEKTEEILFKLEELVNMKEVPNDKKTVFIEKVKEIIKELQVNITDSMLTETGNLQTLISELITVMKQFQEESDTMESFTKNETVTNMIEELVAIIEKHTEKIETSSKSMEDNIDYELENIQQASKESESTASKESGEIEKAKTDGTISREPQINLNQDNKGESTVKDSKPANKELQLESTEDVEEVREALNRKADKVTTEGRTNGKQGDAAGENKEIAKEIPKAENIIQNKPVNEEIIAAKKEQTVLDNKLEDIQNQAVPVKAQTISKTDIIDQIVKKAEIVFDKALPEMRIQLEPENLGKLTLKIAVEKGLITAKFVAESYEVKKTIESSFNELKDMLQEKGLEIQNLSVSVGHNNSDYDNRNTFHQWEEQVKMRGRSMKKGSYIGYPDGAGMPESIVNPYSVHNGEFDHRA